MTAVLRASAYSHARAVSRAVAVHWVLTSFATIPRSLQLRELCSFELLDRVLERTILTHPLLWGLNLDFLVGQEEAIEVAARIDWLNKKFATNGLGNDGEIPLGDDDNFEAALSKRLKIFRERVVELARRHRCDAAEWSVYLRRDPAVKHLSDTVDREFNLMPLSESYWSRVERFEDRVRKKRIVGNYAIDAAGLAITVRAAPLPK